jgi:LacI family transcriptional regulator
MKVTIREVARAAGVSVATVSRVFNDSGPVHEATRQRVRDAAGRLRYVPHGAARSLITRRTATIGVLLPDLHGEFFSEVIRGIDQTATRSGYHLLVSSAHADRSELEAALRAMRGRVDGLIVMSPDIDAEALAANLGESQPAVLLNCAVRGGPWPALTVDNVGGAEAMTRHLLGHGHRRVAILTGAARNLDSRERVRGWRAAMRAAGIEPRPEWEVAGDFTEDSGWEGARRILALAPRPTAIFAANDSMAIGALSALREAGVGVPDEMAVAGFDDIPIARYVSPPISSVHVPIAELGERALARLVQTIESRRRGNGTGSSGTRAPRREVLRTTLVIRGSCGAPGHA